MEGTSMFRTIGAKEGLVDRVVNELERLIVERELKPGTKLPPERDLAEQIGVSRTVIREAVRILVTKGLLTTKHGVGTVVQAANLDNVVASLSLLLRTRGISLDNLHQVRSILELENAGLAAAQATEADVACLRRILSDMESATADSETFASLDAEFHTAIAQTTHNPLLIVLLDPIRDLMRDIRLSVSRYPELFSTVMPDHREIVDRIVAKDAEGARQAMRKHLENARSIQEKFLAERQNGNHASTEFADTPRPVTEPAVSK